LSAVKLPLKVILPKIRAIIGPNATIFAQVLARDLAAIKSLKLFSLVLFLTYPI
jgi:hypothetical protein